MTEKTLFERIKESKMDQKIAWYKNHRTVIVTVAVFIIGALGGNTDRIYESLPDFGQEVKQDLEKVKEEVKQIDVRVNKLEFPAPNQKEVEEKFPEIQRLDLSVLKGN